MGRRIWRSAPARILSGAMGSFCILALVMGQSLSAAATPVSPEIDHVKDLADAVETALAETASRRPVIPLPSRFCGIVDEPDYADYASGVMDEMARSGHDVFEIAIPCAEKKLILQPEADRAGFSQWIIISGHLDEDEAPLLDIGMEPAAYFSGLFDEISAGTDGIEDMLTDTGMAQPEFDAPVRDPNALYWPLVLELSKDGEIMPVRGVAAVTLLGRRPVVTYWYANQSHGVRSSETILADQRSFTAQLTASNASRARDKGAPGDRDRTSASFPWVFTLGVVLGLTLLGFMVRQMTRRRPNLDMS